MKQIILGTAGHIDHGKTALVKALTGTDTDRLPEEKKRGITIDLGFAHLQIGDTSFGIVDVPGHEDLVRNMLAGATGMDAVMLVVAADEGIMPQTREHVAILDQLGVAQAVVALTKSDLADPEWIDLVCDDVRQLLAKTSLDNAAIIPVSVVTNEGIENLREALTSFAPNRASAADVTRLPIDRVFTVKGTGTVVTGTLWSGALKLDDTVELQPSGKRARVRAIQVHGNTADHASAGARVAVALAGVDKDDVQRGEALVRPELWSAAQMITIRSRKAAHTDWTIEDRQRVRVHLGTSEVLGRVVLLDHEWMQLRLEAPLHARVGDRLVLRSYSPVETIGGGVVAFIDRSKRTRLSQTEREMLEHVLDGNVSAAVRLHAIDGVRADRLKLVPGDVKDDVVRVGSRVFDVDVAEGVVKRLLETAATLHAENPLTPILSRAHLRERAGYAPDELIEWAIQRALAGGLLTATGSGIRLAGFEPRLTTRQTALKTALLAAIVSSGLAAPTVPELARSHGHAEDVLPLLRLLETEGAVVAVSPELFIARSAVAEAIASIRARFDGSEPLSASTFKEVLGVSRKHLIPLLEYMDRAGVTLRSGDARTVQPAVK